MNVSPIRTHLVQSYAVFGMKYEENANEVLHTAYSSLHTDKKRPAARRSWFEKKTI